MHNLRSDSLYTTSGLSGVIVHLNLAGVGGTLHTVSCVSISSLLRIWSTHMATRRKARLKILSHGHVIAATTVDEKLLA